MVWLHITSGRGPDECGWVVTRLLSYIMERAEERALTVRVLETSPGERMDVLKSALVALEGEGFQAFSDEWDGTVLWTGPSMFRPGHKRKNWFVGVSVLQVPETRDPSDGRYKIETMRSSGPGGQHVNKTESAVRITHVETGLSATAREERSQHMNRKLAMSRLQALLADKVKEDRKQSGKDRWGNHNDLMRGNPVKTFKGLDFREV
jgi:peptide chain release factor